MEGFSTPLSNKRTAGLPNPCPIGLQFCCSFLPGSLPFGLSQVTAPCQTHTQWEPATRPCRWIHNHRDPRHQSVLVPAWIGPTAHQDTRPSPWAHCPSGPAEPQPRMGPRTPTSPIRPCLTPAPCGMTGTLCRWDRHHPGVRQPHPRACQEPHTLSGASPSSTGFPDKRSTRIAGLPLEGSKRA
jgi:hypothetical protein